MTDNVEARDVAYLALGRLIAGQSPPGFDSATLGMEIHEGQTHLSIVSVQPDGTEVQLQPGEEAARDILELLRSIRGEMEREESRAWRSCKVTLRAGGYFAIDFAY